MRVLYHKGEKMSSLEGANSVRDGRKIFFAIVEEIGGVCFGKAGKNLCLVFWDVETSIPYTKNILCVDAVTL
jgi:hypothetical protein